jgi:hypothetical protein
VKTTQICRLWAGLLSGAAAGAAGTTALNVITYLDIALRGRPTSTTPECVSSSPSAPPIVTNFGPGPFLTLVVF